MGRSMLFLLTAVVAAATTQPTGSSTSAPAPDGAVLSEVALRTVPDLRERLASDDPAIRLRLVEGLVRSERIHDISTYSPSYDLPDTDYSLILQRALPGASKNVQDESALVRALSKVAFLAGRVPLVGVAGAVSEFLEHSGESVRHQAVRTLFALGAEETKAKIFETCLADRPPIRADPYAIAVLVKWQEPRAIPLAMIWLTDGNLARRDMMAERLARTKAMAIEPFLLALLKDPALVGGDRETDAAVRTAVMRLLSRLESRKAVPVLRKIVAGTDRRLAAMAAEELGRLRAEEAIPELLAMLSRGHLSDYYAATGALARIGSPTTVGRVLAELRKRRFGAHHVQILMLLGAVSDPTTYRQLETTRVDRAEVASIRDLLDHVAKRSGVKIVMPDRARAEARSADARGQVRESALSALVAAVDGLNYSAYRYAVFMENGVVRLVLIQHVHHLWDKWLAKQDPEPGADRRIR